MKEEDEEKTAFHTDKGIFCYQKMHFGLKNAGETYQRLVDKAFASQISRNMEAYVDDLVIKSRTEYQMLDDIQETFKNLRKVNMKLNPEKCSFGIKANPNKVKAVLETKPPRSKKEVESLNGKLAALKRFTSELAESSLPFFKTLKGCSDKKDFKWTEEAEEAFNQMKQHLASLPDIAAPETGELISVYLSVAEEAISAVLTIERDKVQVEKLEVFTDSLLVSSQVNDSYVAKEPNMKKYKEKSKELMNTFQTCTINQIPRSRNKKADALSKLASLTFAHLTKKVLVEVLKTPSIEELEVQDVITEEGTNWMTPIKKLLKNGELPTDQAEAERVKVKSRQYVLQGEILYKKGYLAPLLRCVGAEQSKYLIKEVHEGICRAHFGARTVVAELMNLGYFWPSMHRDTTEQLRKCDSCQIHAPVSKSPKHDLVPITSTWPFYKWGMDIIGPFPQQKIIDFIWENIICRYGLPGVLVTDNGKQFAEKPFSVWCKEFKIAQVFSSVAYPQSNGQLERMNRIIVEGIKAKLGRYESNWLEELPSVLWAIRTTEKTRHKRTPYSLVFRSEAVIPAEVGVVTQRTVNMDSEANQKETMLNLQLLQEARDQAAIQEAKYKQVMEAYYNKRVKHERFKPGDLVLRNNEASKKENQGKLGPK
ncbi:uncharacterized protein K02A2.6-like [Helianthus annuus]|uniref:uncharacterized protein K02A2.6-like n=1 Tax=Helianthus annuus TaxID=4232 RepID=UPI001652FDD6|nr:uncharacterized protein K02A2.6-like [Helianthus annuus]